MTTRLPHRSARPRVGCRRDPQRERFPDGQAIYIFTVRDGTGLFHDHGHGCMTTEEAEAHVRRMIAEGEPCAACGLPMDEDHPEC
jgi:hypothetical protein